MFQKKNLDRFGDLLYGYLFYLLTKCRQLGNFPKKKWK